MAADTKQCPYCAEDILAAAVKCKHCGADLAAPSKTQRQATSGSNAGTKLGGVLVIAATVAWCGGLASGNGQMGGLAIILFPVGVLLFIAGRSRVRNAQRREAARR
jgi:hypothetical protein